MIKENAETRLASARAFLFTRIKWIVLPRLRLNRIARQAPLNMTNVDKMQSTPLEGKLVRHSFDMGPRLPS